MKHANQKNHPAFCLGLSSATILGCITAFLVLLTSTTYAQNTQSEVEIIQEAFGLDKKVAVANFIELGDNASAFWQLYDAYETKRKQLGMDRINVISDYAKSYSTITDEDILNLYKRTINYKKSFAKLQQTYFKKMSKAVGPRIAAQFWQLETFFSVMIQAEIYTQIPFIGENLKQD